jgi:DNA-binding MltR family transcriptional regulator
MTASTAAKKKLRKLLNQLPDDRSINSVLRGLNEVDNGFADHAIAVVAATVVEKALQVAITTRFAKVTEENWDEIFRFDRGPLGTLSSKIKLAHALGLFGPKTRSDLDHVREIRNAFAHSMSLIRFDTPEVADICEQLHTPSTATLLTSFGVTPRAKYLNTTTMIAERLKQGIRMTIARIRAPKARTGWLHLRRDMLP